VAGWLQLRQMQMQMQMQMQLRAHFLPDVTDAIL